MGDPPGKVITFREEGNQDPGKTPGDIKIVLEQKEHNFLRRAGDDIFVSKKISLAESLTGLEFSFMHLDKRPILVKSPEKQVIDSDSSLVIKGEGMPLAGNPFTKGALVIEFNVIFPKYSELSDVESLNKCLGKKSPKKYPGNIDTYTLENTTKKFTCLWRAVARRDSAHVG